MAPTQYYMIDIGLSQKQIQTLKTCIQNGNGCNFKLSQKSMTKPNTKLMVNSNKFKRYQRALSENTGFILKLNKTEVAKNRSSFGMGISSTTIKCRECGQPLQLQGEGISDSLKSAASKAVQDPSSIQSSLQGLTSDPRVAAAQTATTKGLDVASQIADQIDKTGRTGTDLKQVEKYVKDFDPIGLINYAVDRISDKIHGKSSYDAQQAAKNYNQGIQKAKTFLALPDDQQLQSYNRISTAALRIPFLKNIIPNTFEEYKQHMVEISQRNTTNTSQMLAQHRAKLGLGIVKKPIKVAKKGSEKKSLGENLATIRAVKKLTTQQN
jgi:hypothetical protein